MASVGGNATTSTGRVAEHATRPAQSRSAEGANRIGGAATVSTGRVSQSTRRAVGAMKRSPLPAKLGGSVTMSTGRVAQHVSRPAGAPNPYGS